MKRGHWFFIVLLALVPLVSSLVSAQYFGYSGGFDIPGIIERLKYNASQLFTPLFQSILGNYSEGDTLFVKVLFSLLIFFVVYGVIKKVKMFENSKNISLIVSLVVSILSARAVTQDGVIEGLLIPYSALGLAVSIFFPLLIYFLFVQRAADSGFVRRFAWILYGIVFLVLFYNRYDKISPELQTIYWFGVGAIVVLLILDKQLHYYFKVWELSVFYKGVNKKTVAALQAEYLNIVNVDSPQARSRRFDIQHELTRLGAGVP